MSGFNPTGYSSPSGSSNNVPRLSWQQRRPVSGIHKKTSSSPSNVIFPPPPPPPDVVTSPTPGIRGHRQSVSALTAALTSTPTAAPTSTPAPSRPSSALVVGGWQSRSNSSVSKASPGTFAPGFIKSADDRRNSTSSLAGGIAGENSDFSGRRWVWVRDPERAFVKGEVVLDEDGMLTVRCDDGTERNVHSDNVDKVNPAKFDKADDMAELTHLNEASVVHNLHLRYQADLIYTYSGLFLVTVNPYCALPIYNNDYISLYKNRSREETKPHIFAITDVAFRNMLEEKENQSILVTGESGAGKTENTKKVIQYLAAVASESSSSKQLGTLELQILRANPILEAFGNAQTVRNNNSSRFGKFIRIEFTRSGQIAGAFIDWYLLEKSRVVNQGGDERNYHVFYQLLRGASSQMKEMYLLDDENVKAWNYIKNSNDTIAGVNDLEEFRSLMEAFYVMGFGTEEQVSILRVIAAVLHIGNIEVVPERRGGEDARLPDRGQAERVSHVLGIPVDGFVKGLLRPRVKAGREWVNQSRTAEQVKQSLDALAKALYERGFGKLVEMVNSKLDTRGEGDGFIGVLDIAGFEIFEVNSFEQLCINYTNEKLQQFFNHHMFVLEQEEYEREKIEWKFIDFGHDLQPTIDLIELPNPIGIFSCLDEDCVMPKASDKSFTEKLHFLWDKKTPKYKRSLLKQGFMLTHYAAEVEYSTEGWLDKNKDPLNDNITKLLAASHDKYIASLFADYAEDANENGTVAKSRVKKGLFRTVAQRHKEQLTSLMAQLNSTHPHFVRCIIPNHQKRPKKLNAPLVLDQLRCNGVLEGIRIARTGFPNRLPFAEFRQRYEVLTPKIPKGYLEGQRACQLMLQQLDLDTQLYRVGLTKVFFRAGVLAELEEKRDTLVREIITRFQSIARGYLQRRIARKRLYRAEATMIIQRNLQVYLDLCESPWWKLFMKMKPLLGASHSSNEVKKRDEMIQKMEALMQAEAENRQKLEEERRKTDTELQRVQKTLESERALALDKEEIFERMRQREAELSEKLAGALEDQDLLEDQIDELMSAKKKTDEQAELWRKELEQAGDLVARLEDEKRELAAKIEFLDRELEAAEAARAERGDAEDKLEQEIHVLKSHLNLKERKLQEYEEALKKSDHDLDEKLAQTNFSLETSQKQIRELVDENRTLRDQLSDLSTTSNGYEDLIRRKESELSLLHADLKKLELESTAFDDEKRHLNSKHDDILARLRSAHSEVETLKHQCARLEKEAADARRLLDAKITEDAKTGQGRRLLDEQIKELQEELAAIQAELDKERQSRADIALLSEHKFANLKRDHDAITTAKFTIEKELYAQQDTLRRALEARSQSEKEKRNFQADLKTLRDRLAESDNARLQAESEIEKSLARQAKEKEARLDKDLKAKEEALSIAESERARLASEVARLTRVVSEQDGARQSYEQSRKRMDSETNAVKNRLMASENDNRALQNKIQQKNLEISKANARASEQYRDKIVALTADRTKADEEARKYRKQFEDAQIQMRALEKQKEKLSLNLEDLNHEVAREHKTTRNAEKTTSSLQLQLAEANRTLEMERQVKAQAQVNTKHIQSALATANSELEDCRQQLLVLQKVFDPEGIQPKNWESGRKSIVQSFNLATKLDEANQALRLSNERRIRAEKDLEELRKRHQDEVAEIDNMHTSSKRALLDEMDQNNAPSNGSSRPFSRALNAKQYSNQTTPTRRNLFGQDQFDSEKTDKTMDTISFQRRMDLASELEEVQNQLQIAEMQNKHLQAQIDRVNAKEGELEASPSAKRALKLERENNRLHDLLDESDQKNSALEASMNSIELSLKDIQAKSHEELYDFISQQEQSRRNLVMVYNETVSDLGRAKDQFEKVKAAKAAIETDLRETQTELDEALAMQQQDKVSRAQLLNEFADLQIRLDAESSKVADLGASLNLYKLRSNEYFNKLEQAEILVLRASRAEAAAKSQAKETEENAATVLAERKQMESLIEDLQRQNQHFEEKVEDLSADLSAALQAKKRLQNELDDYRSRREIDLEDKESSMEQTRKKYQTELSTLNGELEIEPVEKMRRAEALAVETQRDIAAERETNVSLHKERASLEKQVKDLQLKLVDLETKSYSTTSHDVRFLHGRVQELEKLLDEQEKERNKSERSVRNVDRTVRDLQTQIERRDKAAIQLEEEVTKGKEKLERLLKTIEELEAAHSEHQLIARRAEREAREEREKSLRLERELEGWKGMRLVDRNANGRSNTMAALSQMGDDDSDRRGSKRHSVNFL
ncbi:P-loop containing nucleoside triphosphate hydrolase protein [Morchella snyderi]|nr:P-loop containing nucleoside triphosphate hydrolase protein [Morchella snyderi]